MNNVLLFVIISVVSGIIAGEILSVVNYFVVEPTTDRAIGYETQRDILKGEPVNLNQIHDYRIWQKSGTFVAGAFIGIAYGSLLGIAYAFSRKYLPFTDERKKAILLAALLYLAIYLVPFSKYPANPPSVGDPDTITLRDHLYATYQIASVTIAVIMGVLFFKYRYISTIKFIVPAIYVLLIASIYFLWAPNPDKIMTPMDTVNTFRALSGITQTLFFLLIGVFFGILWNKFKPHEPAKVTTV